jgi:hypothetical protein
LRLPFFILIVTGCVPLQAQTLGGNTVFNFLRLPGTPELTALGGVNTSQISSDAGLAFNNPALLTPRMHTQMNAVFNSMYDGIQSYHLSLAYHHRKINTSFQWGLDYLNYGSVQQADAAGNLLGTIPANRLGDATFCFTQLPVEVEIRCYREIY